HYLVDRWAAAQESGDGKVRYGPYQATWYSAPPKPAMVPEDVGNLEEALANMEAFRQYINPSYAEGVAKLVEGRLDERNVNEWKAFFIGGGFSVGMGDVFLRQPPGGEDFFRFFYLKNAVGGAEHSRNLDSLNSAVLGAGVEMANVFSRQPPGWKDFVRFLNRKTSVGATNYVRIQYSYNPEMLERGQKELTKRIGGPEAVPNLFTAESPDFPPVFLL